MPYPTQWAGFDPHYFMCCLCFEIMDINFCAIQDGDFVDICILCDRNESHHV